MFVVVALFGDGLLAARLPPLLAGVLLVPVMAALVCELGGGVLAVILAGAWAAFDPYLVRYGVEARPYTWLALFSGLTLLATLRLVRRRGAGAWLLALAGTGLVLCHYYGVVAYGAVLIFLGGSLGALSPRLPGAFLGAATPLLALTLWSPVALHQLSERSMDGIYRGLDLEMAWKIVDAQGLTAPLATAAGGSLLVILGRALLLLLLALGGIVAWRRGVPRSGPTAPGPGGVLLARSALVVGVLAMLLALVVPAEALAGLASQLVKEGRPLDGQNRAFLARVLDLVLIAGAACVVLGLSWPALSRRASRCASRARPAALLLLLLVVPLALVMVLDVLGKSTLAVRNTLFMAPAVIALAATGLERLPRLVLLPALLALAVLAGTSWQHLEGFLGRPDWPAAAALVEASAAEPLAHPPWLARCIEYHGRRPWASVFGSYRPEVVADWARQRSAVALVAGYEPLADSSAVRDALARAFGAPQMTTVRGLRVFIYRR